MSLVKRPTMTPARKAAQRANSRRSRGAVTPEGLERLRSARLLHGFYSEKADEALPALGDDRKGWLPCTPSCSRIGIRAMPWRMSGWNASPVSHGKWNAPNG